MRGITCKFTDLNGYRFLEFLFINKSIIIMRKMLTTDVAESFPMK